jgi:hypothetical protein
VFNGGSGLERQVLQMARKRGVRMFSGGERAMTKIVSFLPNVSVSAHGTGSQTFVDSSLFSFCTIHVDTASRLLPCRRLRSLRFPSPESIICFILLPSSKCSWLLFPPSKFGFRYGRGEMMRNFLPPSNSSFLQRPEGEAQVLPKATTFLFLAS